MHLRACSTRFAAWAGPNTAIQPIWIVGNEPYIFPHVVGADTCVKEAMEIRRAVEADFEAMWPVFQAVVATGDTYAFSPPRPDETPSRIGSAREPRRTLPSRGYGSLACTSFGLISAISAPMLQMPRSWLTRRLKGRVQAQRSGTTAFTRRKTSATKPCNSTLS